MSKPIHPKIVIVGRPNVGKSSLFNRIVGSRKAIVESTCGTTRDRLSADIQWKTKAFTVVDTGGFEPSRRDDMGALILKQLLTAVEEADIIFFVTDAAEGVMPQDIEIAAKLRKTSKKIYVIVNKADDQSRAARAAEFYELGLGDPHAVSATNGTGIGRLLDDVATHIGIPAAATASASLKVAIVGRPNVGKSSFLNSVVQEDRVIVHEAAGTTRDAIDTDFDYKDRTYVLIDTAGIRHHAVINESADFFGSVRSKEAVRRSDAAIVIIDGFDGLREDDQRIIDFVINEGRSLVIAVNKWDLVKGVEMQQYTEMLIRKLNVIRNYPVVFVSSKTRRNVLACLDSVWTTFERSRQMLKPDELKEVLKSLNATPEVMRKKIKFNYLVQEGTCPPSFVLGIKRPDRLTDMLKRRIENILRAYRDYVGVPLRIRYNS